MYTNKHVLQKQMGVIRKILAEEIVCGELV